MTEARTDFNTKVDPRAVQRCAKVALIVSFAIMAVKMLAFGITGSTAILGDAMESIVNIAATGMALFSTWYASRPPDREHPYGHGNVEFITVAVEGLLIGAAGVTIAYESIRRWWEGLEPTTLGAGQILLAITAVSLALLGGWLRWQGRRYDSPVLKADGAHLLTDAMTTVGVIAALALVQATGWAWLDSVVGMVIAGIILVTGTALLRQSWQGLVNRIDPADDKAIRDVVQRYVESGDILGYHKLRWRHIGAFHWVDLHVQLPADMTVRDAHAKASEVEYAIEQLFKQANATVHVEPPENRIDPEA